MTRFAWFITHILTADITAADLLNLFNHKTPNQTGKNKLEKNHNKFSRKHRSKYILANHEDPYRSVWKIWFRYIPPNVWDYKVCDLLVYFKMAALTLLLTTFALDGPIAPDELDATRNAVLLLYSGSHALTEKKNNKTDRPWLKWVIFHAFHLMFCSPTLPSWNMF